MKNKETLYVLVAGSRSFTNYDVLERELTTAITSFIKTEMKSKDDVEIAIVSGGANGADTLAEIYAIHHGTIMCRFPAGWGVHGKAAGFMRNRKMHEFIKQFPHRLCVCFWNRESGRGTAHNFKLSADRDTPLMVYDIIEDKWLPQKDIPLSEERG